MNDTEKIEFLKCGLRPHYFIHTYCQVYDPTPAVRAWLPFHLWPGQRQAYNSMIENDQVIILKARQLGLTWLVVAYALWKMLFEPGSIILLFSMRENEAADLLARIHGATEERIGGMYDMLPEFFREGAETTISNQLELVLANGSVARAFPATKRAGRSFTASMVIVDEADFLPYFKQLMTAVRPTIDAGGQIMALSTSDKEKPASEFKRLFKEAQAKLNGWKSVFLPWSTRPGRTAAWYAAKAASYEQDDLWQEYPATILEALAGRSAGKRFQPAWLNACYEAGRPIDSAGPAIPGLIVYEQPEDGRSYTIAVDTSEGDVTSDPSPATVFDDETWAEVAHLHGVFEPETLAGYTGQLSDYYSNATLCVERNNHGHAVHVALHALDYDNRIYINPFDNKEGWLSNLKYKTLAMDTAATIFKEGSATIRTEATQLELGSIEAATLKAPEGEYDDRALSFVIGLAALRWPTTYVPAVLVQATASGWNP